MQRRDVTDYGLQQERSAEDAEDDRPGRWHEFGATIPGSERGYIDQLLYGGCSISSTAPPLRQVGAGAYYGCEPDETRGRAERAMPEWEIRRAMIFDLPDAIRRALNTDPEGN